MEYFISGYLIKNGITHNTKGVDFEPEPTDAIDFSIKSFLKRYLFAMIVLIRISRLNWTH